MTATSFKRKVLYSLVILFVSLFIIGTGSSAKLYAETTSGTEMAEDKAMSNAEASASVSRFALIAAAVAFGLSAIGAGIAIANVGAAAMGAIAEKPEIGGQALIFVALAEGLVVFGFITAILILGKI